jgi:tetratricopeptide (TPR) repeat protein
MKRTPVAYLLAALILIPPLIFLPELYHQEGGIPRIVLGRWLILAAAITWLLRSFRSGKLSWTRNKVLAPFFAFLCVNLLSLALTPHRYYGIQFVGDIFFLLLLLVIAINIPKSQSRFLLNTLLISCSLLSLIAVLQYVGALNVNWEMLPWEKGLGKRAYSTLGNPNNLASILVLILPLSMVFFLTETDTKRQYLYGTAAILSFVALLFTNSWGGWSGFIGAIVVLLVATRRAKIHLLKRNIALLCIVLSLCTLLFLTDKGKKVVGEPTAAKARILLWDTAIHMIRDKPVLGFGPDNFMAISNKYMCKLQLKPAYSTIWQKRADFVLRNPGRVHNEYLSILVETGVIGLAVFIWFIVALYRRLSDYEKESKTFNKLLLIGGLASLTAFLIDSFMNFPLRTPTSAKTFILILGLALGGTKSELRLPKTAIILSITVLSGLFLLSAMPLFSGYYFTKGVAEEARGKRQSAIELYQRSLEFGTFSHLVYSKLGTDYEVIEDHKNGIASFIKAREIQPYHEVMHFNLGVTYRRTGASDKAMVAFRRAIELEPRYGMAYSYLAELLIRDGQSSEGLELLKSAAKLIPSATEVRNDLGVAFARSGDFPNAEREFNVALPLSRGDMLVRYNFYLARKKARTGYIDASAIDDLRPLLAAAEKELKSKDFAKARQSYNAILVRHPDYPDALINLAAICELREELETSKSLLIKAFTILPSNKTVRKRLANILAKTGDFERCVALVEKANEYYEKKMFNKAEESLLEAMEINPTHTQSYYNLGVLYANDKKDPEKAADYFRKFIELEPRHPDAANILSVIRKQKQLVGAKVSANHKIPQDLHRR